MTVQGRLLVTLTLTFDSSSLADNNYLLPPFSIAGYLP